MRLTGRSGTVGAGLAGLCLGLLAIGPGLGPGFVLSYDMVFVPRPAFGSTMFGLSGTLPRAVPSDAVITVLAHVLPAELVQKLVLLTIFALACAGVAALTENEPYAARLAAGVCFSWNPFVAERLILGQWALLLGYAGLPWVLRAATRPAAPALRWAGSLGLALLPAAVGGFAPMCVTGLIALPATVLGAGRTARQRVQAGLAAAGVLAVLSLPWLIPSLTRVVHTSGAGVAAFTARADTPFGSLGSLLMLGGAWNSQTVPYGYGGAASALWLCIIASGLLGFVALGRGRWPGLGAGAAAGLLIAGNGITGFGREVLRALIATWPGFAILRDGQQFVAPLALLEALGLGLDVAWVLKRDWPARLAELRWLAATLAVIAPVMLLPGLAWGAAGRLRAVHYPVSWLRARAMINADQAAGSALLLPWAAYRRFGWNHGEALLDPWPRLVTRNVIWNDAVTVGPITVPPESPQVRAISAEIAARGPLTSALQAAGVRYVIVDAGFGAGHSGRRLSSADPYRGRLPGCPVMLAEPGILVYRIPPVARGQ